jgi:phage shock protein C
MAEKRLARSTTDRVIAGVCAGLASYFGLDPVIMRVIFVVLALAGGPGILLYLILWIVMPEDTTATPPPPPSA